jgi:Fe-S cluster assembly ATPase SufC
VYVLPYSVPAEERQFPTANLAIQVERPYRRNQVLAGVDLTVPRGAIHALLGRAGRS